MPLDSRPARSDLLTSREVSKILGGVLSGLSQVEGRGVVRAALNALDLNQQTVGIGTGSLRCARIIGATLGGLADVASTPAVIEGLKFWIETPEAVDQLPDKAMENG